MAAKAVRLSQLSHGAGCACKLRPADLAQVLRDLRTFPDKRALVGHQTSDDAAFYQLNAISDIYAMGATPLFALNVVAFPSRDLPLTILRDILRGGSDKAAEARIAV